MPTKVFTVMGGVCPFGNGCEIDSQSCRKCQWFYRAGTGTFFWCNHPIEQKQDEIARKAPEIEQKSAEIEQKAPEIAQTKRKRGRPPGKAIKKPVKRVKNKK